MKKAQLTFTGIKIAVGLALAIVFTIAIYLVMNKVGQGGTPGMLTHVPVLFCLARTRLRSCRAR